MSNTCPKTPYSAKTDPYSEKVNPFANKESVLSSITGKISSMLSPYGDKYFCPTDFLLQENGFFLFQQNGDKIIL